MPPSQVLVVDVRADHICLDLLVKTLDIRQIAGKEAILLAAMRAVDGLDVKEDAYIDAAGIFGIIGCQENDTPLILAGPRN